MKAIQIELPDQLADVAEHLVRAGWYTSQSELMRQALVEFIRYHQRELQEQFLLEDIAWARRLHDQRQTQT